MDIRALLTFVANHVEQIFGVTLILFFVTSLLLLIRSIRQKDDESATSGHGSGIDAQTVEDAVRRALGTTPIQVAAGPVDGAAPVAVAEGDPAALEKYKQEVQKRDIRIDELSKEIAALREQIKSATSAGGDGSAPAISDAELKDLKAKLEEMQARLAEYEIIEDDIADLSQFKEENARLKAEIDDLKNRLANAGTAAPAAAAPVAAATAAAGESAFARAGEAPAAAPTETSKAEAATETQTNASAPAQDDVMREFAAAVEAQRAPPAGAASSVPYDADAIASMASGTSAIQPPEDPQASIDAMLAQAESQMETVAAVTSPAPAQAADDVLAGSPDPDKMLAEVASLLAEDTGDSSALEDTLDTDKLLAEVGNLDSAPATPTSDQLSDDLLAEFAGEAIPKTPKG